MSGQFDETFLAGFPALTFSYLIPIAEVAIGISLLIGWKVIPLQVQKETNGIFGGLEECAAREVKIPGDLLKWRRFSLVEAPVPLLRPALLFQQITPAFVSFGALLGIIRWGGFAGCLLMDGIMLGTCVLEKWDLLASQLIHLYLFYVILTNPNTPEGSVKAA